MQRFLYYFKCEGLSKQKSINRRSDEVVLLWQKVAVTSGYSCYKYKGFEIRSSQELTRSGMSIAQRKLGVTKSSNEQANAVKIYMAKLESLFDIAKQGHKIAGSFREKKNTSKK